MVSFPNAKINIGLNITEKRSDNYHNLESIFVPIPIKDILEIVRKKEGESELHLSGIAIDGDPNDNLIMKAYHLLQSEYNLPAVDIYLEKNIPFGAGLGGGSADAAFTLKMLNDEFELHLTTEQLESYAARLGADCAFFIQNKPTYATGIGNIFQPVEVNLDNYFLVLVKPDVHVSTKEAYSLIRPQKTEVSVFEKIQRPIETWKEEISNDFELSVFPQHPIIAEVKSLLYQKGAVYASMSGSGSSVFGIFREEVDLQTNFPGMFVFQNRFQF